MTTPFVTQSRTSRGPNPWQSVQAVLLEQMDFRQWWDGWFHQFAYQPGLREQPLEVVFSVADQLAVVMGKIDDAISQVTSSGGMPWEEGDLLRDDVAALLCQFADKAAMVKDIPALTQEIYLMILRRADAGMITWEQAELIDATLNHTLGQLREEEDQRLPRT